MGEHSTIEWTDHTFNPWEGCSKVSEACKNCYAEVRDWWLHPSVPKADRKTGEKAKPKHWGVDAPRLFHGDEYWGRPLRWNQEAQTVEQRRRVFCASLADVFEDRRDLDPHRERLWKLIEATEALDWLLLTKRPQHIKRAVPWDLERPSNVWLGTTVENQQRVEERLPHLVDNPAVVRFLSIEPLLGPVDLRTFLTEIDWVILGGESGFHPRPTQIEWARSVRDQCIEFGVPFLFKQWGNHAQVDGKGEQLVKLRTKSERLLDGRTWDQFPSPKMDRIVRLAVSGERPVVEFGQLQGKVTKAVDVQI